MENTFNLKKFLVENKLTSNSRLLNEVEQSVQIANNLKKIKVDAEAVISMAKKGIEDQEKYAGLNRDVNIDVQAVEQQIEVVEDALERIEDYAGDGWATDIEDVAKEKNIAELQNMLETLVNETDKLHSVYTGKPLQEGELNEGWKNWALGAITALSVLGGGAALNNYQTVDQGKPDIELVQTQKDKAGEKSSSDYVMNDDSDYTRGQLLISRYTIPSYRAEIEKLGETDLHVKFLLKYLKTFKDIDNLSYDEIEHIGKTEKTAIEKVLAIKY
jgi:hypothetical protein